MGVYLSGRTPPQEMHCPTLMVGGRGGFQKLSHQPGFIGLDDCNIFSEIAVSCFLDEFLEDGGGSGGSPSLGNVTFFSKIVQK